MQHFIYITTNLVNGKYYIGKKSTSNKTLNPNYLGSGVALKSAIKKYGKNNFRREIICFTNSKNANAALECVLVTTEVCNDQLCYNIAIGGQGGDLGLDANAKRRAALKGKSLSLEAREKMSITRKGRPSHNKGKTFSPEARARMSASKKAYYDAKKNDLT